MAKIILFSVVELKFLAGIVILNPVYKQPLL